MSRARDFADLASAYSGGALGNRNIIHNGNMAVHQRGGTITANGYSLDGWRILSGNLDNLAFEVTQAADVPSTFAGSGGKSLKFQTKTVESALAADEEMRIASLIEAQNCQHLLYGGSSAKKFTVSFWVKSSLTGTFAVMMYMEDGALNIGSTYTISSADTWEHKTVNIVGNTSQALSNDNTIGFYIQWVLFAGSDYTSTDNTSWASYATGRLGYGHAQNGLATTDESTWQLTGVQMEGGEVATPFEHESYGTNLAKCQRYFQKWLADTANDSVAAAGAWADTTYIAEYHLQNTMRSPPAITFNGTFVWSSSGNDRSTSSNAINRATKEQVQWSGVISDNNEIGKAGFFRAGSDSDAYIEFSSEL